MTEGIIIAIVSGLFSTIASLTASILVFISSNKKMQAETEKSRKEEIQKQNDKIDNLSAEISGKLEAHKEEYIKEINDIRNNINQLRSDNEHHQDIVKMEIVNLSNRVEKHNQVIDRMYKAETEIDILKTKVDALGKS